MKCYNSIALLVLSLVLLSGCGSSNNPAMTGTWQFTLTSTGAPAQIITFTANLTQKGAQITGLVTLSGAAAGCGSSATMSGNLQGNTLTLQLAQTESALNLTGTVNLTFTQATGTYIPMAGSCLQNGGEGSWTATLE